MQSTQYRSQVALVLFFFCKRAHIAWAAHTHLILASMEEFYTDVGRSIVGFTGVGVPDVAWRQAQLSLRRREFRMHFFFIVSSFISSLYSIFCGSDYVISTPRFGKCHHTLQQLCFTSLLPTLSHDTKS